MNTAFYTGASGLRAYQNDIDITSHNITNSNTYGYKYTNSEFRELLLSDMEINKNREITAEEDKIKRGHGVKLSGQELIFEQGSLVSTGYELDFAITGNALFGIETRKGTIEYTKNGSFDMSVEQDGNYLTSSNGEYVLDSNGNHIKIPYDEYDNVDTGALKNTLGIFTFDNCYGLTRVDGSRFLTSVNSGAPRLAEQSTYNVYSSTLERSNVNLATEMADLIVGQKAYQFSARVVSVADEIEQVANSLRR